PYVALEAAFAKVPIISTNVGGLPEIVTDMESGILVHPKSSKEIREAIRHLIDRPEQRKTLAENLYFSASSKFTLEIMVRQYIMEVY
ncbi:MAG: glycosyltransferase family 4 protein, partial [bacterium]|nr:glycosyltransferase family 4 protein [bacterium]